jgi:hypothetical protein
MNPDLVPEARTNKLGHVVVKHVKPVGAAPSASTARIPAPALSFSTVVKEMDSRELTDGISENISNTGFDFTDRHRSFLMGINVDDLKFLHGLSQRLDHDGAESLLKSTPNRFASPSVSDHEVFMTACHAYDYCKGVIDADPSNKGWDFVGKADLFGFAKRTFEGATAAYRRDEDTVSDLEGAFLVHRLRIGKEGFRSEGSYYRGLAKLKEQREEIEPYMPLLLAMATAYPTGNGGWHFGEEYYLWENLDDIKKFPVEKIGAIARATIDRGEYDPKIAELVMQNASDSLADGIL